MRWFLIFLLLNVVMSVHAKVSVQLNHMVLDFADNPRLTDVLAGVNQQQSWYWPATALYRLDTLLAEQQRRNIITQLDFVELSLDQTSALKVRSLIAQIKQWQLADRVMVPIDYDAARVNLNNNPRFENGTYRLELMTRPTTATVFGLIEQPIKLDLGTQQCAEDYIQHLNIDLANRDYVYIIQPDGVIKKTGVAYWNSACEDIMPGSQIYLGLPESQFFNHNNQLNEQIAQLATSKLGL